MAKENGPLMIGLDLGTTGVKAGVIDAAGGVLGKAFAPYRTMTPAPGWAEQDPQEWWSATVAAVRDALESSGADPGRIAGAGVSGQMHGSVFLDAGGEVVRPCILWCDQRTSEECEMITSELGGELAALVGNPALTGFTAPKILWLRDAEPECYSRVSRVVLPKDYINMRLTGRLTTEVSDASGTLLFDIRRREWSRRMLEALDVPAAWLPDVLESSDPQGGVTREAADATGLAAGTVVAAGGADNACGAIGMGVLREGDMAVSIGSSGTVLAPTGAPVVDERMRLHSFCHAVPGAWYVMGVMLSAGQSLRWFRDVLGEPETGRALSEGRDAYELLDETASKAPAGSEGLLFLPYLSGERTPHADPHARGGFFGLDLTKKRSHVVRSVMEGVTFGLKDSLEIMRDMGVPLDAVVSGGGGARSALWRSMQADVFEMPVRTVSEPDAAMLGAALLGGAAGGVFATVQDASAAAVRYGDDTVPEPSNFEAYREAYGKFRALYPALKPLF